MWNRTALIIILSGLAALIIAIVINSFFALVIGGGICIICMISSFLVSMNEKIDDN